jgi:pyruvate formate lyase activating enzyme
MHGIPGTPIETLIRARSQAIEAGLKYVYTGNVNDVARQSTYCPKCQKCLIERNWYELGAFEIVQGCCSHCKEPIPGVFEESKGSWGRKRQPVAMS